MSITFVLLQKMKTINEANVFFVVTFFFFFFLDCVPLKNIFKNTGGGTVSASVLLHLCQCCLSDTSNQFCMTGELSATWAQLKDLSVLIGH